MNLTGSKRGSHWPGKGKMSRNARKAFPATVRPMIVSERKVPAVASPFRLPNGRLLNKLLPEATLIGLAPLAMQLKATGRKSRQSKRKKGPPVRSDDSGNHEPLSKRLKFDTAVPGNRGDCEKQSLTQGSE
jgi:hypothetical protein